jgi:hypothetical protein
LIFAAAHFNMLPVVSRVFKHLGVGKALFVYPLVAGLGYLFLLRSPSITFMYWLKVADDSLDYSLGNTTKQALWLPTSREAKYKAKQAVDSFFMRAGVGTVGARHASFCGGQRGAGGRMALHCRDDQYQPAA